MKRGFALVAVAAACIYPWAAAEAGSGTPEQSSQGTSEMGYLGMAHGTIAGINPAALAALNITEEQRRKITEIQRDLQRKQWPLKGQLRELRWTQEDAMMASAIDVDAARKTYAAMAVIRQEMFDATLDARKRIEALLTKEQRIQLTERSRALAQANSGVVSAGSAQKNSRH